MQETKKNLLIVTASFAEAAVFSDVDQWFPAVDIKVVVTGAGTMANALGLMRYLRNNPAPHLALNAGIAGSFRPGMPAGFTGIIARDAFADFGIDDRGRFIPAAAAGLAGEDHFPFSSEGWIECNNIYTKQLRGKFHFITGITSDTVSGSAGRIESLKERFNPDTESMEGASFFYICALEKIPYLAIRAVSNMIEERNRENWNIPLALRNLREKTREILTLLFTRE